MCFSATASFSASVFLAITGAVAIASIPKKRWLFFALIPFLFSLQQFFEGMIWINGGGSGRFFLFFAFIIWPIWIPVSLLVIEKKDLPRRLLSGLLGLGVLIAIVYAYFLIFYHPAVTLHDHHVGYKFVHDMPKVGFSIMLIFYAMCSIGSFFVSSRKYMSIFGILALGTCVVALYFYTACFVSVWCFFAAVASFFVIVIMQKKRTRSSRHSR